MQRWIVEYICHLLYGMEDRGVNEWVYPLLELIDNLEHHEQFF